MSSRRRNGGYGGAWRGKSHISSTSRWKPQLPDGGESFNFHPPWQQRFGRRSCSPLWILRNISFDDCMNSVFVRFMACRGTIISSPSTTSPELDCPGWAIAMSSMQVSQDSSRHSCGGFIWGTSSTDLLSSHCQEPLSSLRWMFDLIIIVNVIMMKVQAISIKKWW